MLPALAIVSSACGLAAAPVGALELGEIRLDSALGQPLRASIAYALNPAEQLNQYCIYLRPGISGSGIPTISNARITVTDSAIVLAGVLPVREPMVSIQVAVDCPYTPHLRREYTLMINPAEPFAIERTTIPATMPAAVESSAVKSVSRRETEVRASSSATAPAQPLSVRVPQPSARSAATNTPAVPMKTTYWVLPGDTVSTIVARIEGRTIGLWTGVAAVHAANPDAFIDNDVNRLMAGFDLVIPDMTGSTAASNVVATVADYSAPTITPAVTAATADTASDLQPGDVVMAPIDSADTTILIPDTAIDNDRATVIAPIVDTAATANGLTNSAWSWLMWLGGTGLALILGLLLFGRTIKERFAPTSAKTGGQRYDDSSDQVRVGDNTDAEFEDTVNERLFSLDANLESGAGLQENEELSVAQDLGFPDSDESEHSLAREVPSESDSAADTGTTHILKPVHRVEDTSILTAEESPLDDGDDTELYDISITTEVPEQTICDSDDTATDLQAVQIEIDSDITLEVEYTLASAVDYEVLEQDYEDELSASQIMSAEIESASKELTERIDAENQSNTTSLLPSIDVTAEITAEITAEMTASLPASLEAENDEVIPPSERTAAGNDVTVDMKVATGKLKKN